MTTALDRLERAGLARRTRDAVDRRRVLVEITPTRATRGGALLRRAHRPRPSACTSATRQQLELLLEFVREGRELNETQAAQLEQQNRERKTGS